MIAESSSEKRARERRTHLVFFSASPGTLSDTSAWMCVSGIHFYSLVFHSVILLRVRNTILGSVTNTRHLCASLLRASFTMSININLFAMNFWDKTFLILRSPPSLIWRGEFWIFDAGLENIEEVDARSFIGLLWLSWELRSF